MKLLKILLFSAGALVLAAAIGVAVFAMTFDPNRYKGEIEAAVKEKTGRTLKLEGDLKVAIFPSLGADVSRVSLSERQAAREFVSLESAHVSVAVLPLLHGEVIVDRIRVSGLKARIVKGKDGKFNFDDLLEAKANPAAPEKGAAKPGQAVRFDIAGVSIERSSVSYQDLASGQEFSLSEVRFATGRVAEKADGKLEFSAAATAAGKGGKPLEVRVSLSGSYHADLAAKVFALSSLSSEIALSGAELPKPLKIALSGDLRADLGKESANADLVSKIDDSTIKAKLGMTKFSAPAYTFDIDIDRLNLDPYFPPQPKPAASAPAPAGKGGGEAKAEDSTVDLAALKTLNAKGRLHCGALQAKGLKLAELKAEVHAANGRLDLSPHSASLYEGTLAGALGLQADGNRVTLKETMTNVSIGPLLRDAAQQDRLEGRGNVTLDVGGGGPSVNAIKKSLAGAAKVNLRDGAIKGVDLGALLAKVKSLGGKAEEGSANGKDQTKFTELNASFAIRNGVASNNDLDLKAPLIRVGGAGDIDIGNSSINYVVKPALVATAKGQGGEGAGQLAGVTVPVKLSGPFDSMRYEVDYGAVAADLAKSEAGKKAKEALDKNKDKLEGQVRDRLKGLFGR